MADQPFSHVITIADVPPRGLHLHLEPTETERVRLAAYLGLPAVPGVVAHLHIVPEGAEGLHVTGTLDARVVQTCGVTLEAFEAQVREDIDVHFVPAGTVAPPEVADDESYDPPDEIVNGSVDMGALITEFLVLGIDPYPRKPGVAFDAPDEDPAAQSPFAVLARLKDQKAP